MKKLQKINLSDMTNAMSGMELKHVVGGACSDSGLCEDPMGNCVDCCNT